MALLKGKFVDKDQLIQSNLNPTEEKDLSRKAYVDSAAAAAASDKLPLAGGNMTGAIDMGGNEISNVADPVNAGDAATKNYVDDGLAEKADLVDGKVPASQLPSYVDDVVEYADVAAFPAEGEPSKIYVALDTNKTYRWSGTQYIEISASPGTTDEIAEGLTNLYYTDSRAASAAPVQSVNGKTGSVTLAKDDVGLGNVDNTSDADKPISTAVATALAGKQASLGNGTTSQYLRGDLTWQEISASWPVAQVKHVSKNGVDASADGSEEKPYLTLSAAMASITDASPTKRYVIRVAAGSYTEASVSLKANVFVIGESKESVRITGAVSMNADWNQPSANDCRGGFSMISLLSAADFNWSTVTSPSGKLYFNEVVFGSTLALYGHNNAIAQAQFDSCVIFGAFTISGINVGVFTNNICYSNVTCNQHPGGGMATIFAATGGSCSGTVKFYTTVSDFNRRCSGFLKAFNCENLIIDGPSSYADVDLLSQGKSSTQKLNGGTLVALNPRINHDLETQMLKPLSTNAHNMGDWGKQWFFNFGYVHASSGTDLYVISAMESYDPAGDSSGKNVFINADGYGLKPDVNGGNIELETAAVSGTGVRGKVQVKARELDMTSAKITNLADGVAASDAINKGQLDAAIGAIPAGAAPKKEKFILTSTDISNGYVDCAHLAIADSMLLMSGGIPHQEGIDEDYTLSAVAGVTRITFMSGFLSKLSANDRIFVMYQK